MAEFYELLPLGENQLRLVTLEETKIKGASAIKNISEGDTRFILGQLLKLLAPNENLCIRKGKS